MPVVMELAGFLRAAETEPVTSAVLYVTTHETFQGWEVRAGKVIIGYASWKRGYLSFCYL